MLRDPVLLKLLAKLLTICVIFADQALITNLGFGPGVGLGLGLA